MKIVLKQSFRRRVQRAFTLIEVMIAMGIFFIGLFAILGLTAQLLTNARAFQNTRKPHVSLVHGWWTSKTNRVTEGVTTIEFSDISSDLGELYRDYYTEIEAQPDPEMTNGLWDVTFRLYNRRTHQIDSQVMTLYWDPNTKSKTAGAGLQ